MKWLITGADKETGEDKSIVVHAPHAEAAQKKANGLGVVVERVTPMADAPEPPPQIKRRPPREFHTKIAGVTHANASFPDRQWLLARCKPNLPLALVREPNNPESGWAIKVMTTDGYQLGYIPDDVAATLAADMDRGREVSAAITSLTGGTSDKPTRGANILVRIEGETSMPIVRIEGRQQPEPPLHNCGNCGRVIGALEQPYQWGEAIVCPQCCQLLQSAQAAQPPRSRSYSAPRAAKKSSGCLLPAIGSLVIFLGCAGILGRSCSDAIDKASPSGVLSQHGRKLPPEPLLPHRSDEPAKAEGLNEMPIILSLYGNPDVSDTTENDDPRPMIVTRKFVYNAENVRVTFAPNQRGAIGSAAPITAWLVFGYQDNASDRPLTSAEVDARMVHRYRGP